MILVFSEDNVLSDEKRRRKKLYFFGCQLVRLGCEIIIIIFKSQICNLVASKA